MNQHNTDTVIHANGKSTSGTPDHLDTLEIVINGNQMISQLESTILSSTPGKHLAASINYQLKAFEPQQDGTCVARYVRVNANEK